MTAWGNLLDLTFFTIQFWRILEKTWCHSALVLCLLFTTVSPTLPLLSKRKRDLSDTFKRYWNFILFSKLSHLNCFKISSLAHSLVIKPTQLTGIFCCALLETGEKELQKLSVNFKESAKSNGKKKKCCCIFYIEIVGNWFSLPITLVTRVLESSGKFIGFIMSYWYPKCNQDFHRICSSALSSIYSGKKIIWNDFILGSLKNYFISISSKNSG